MNSETWGMITDVILVAAMAWIGVLSVVGLCQWIKRKNLFKVDMWILWMGAIMVTMGIIYLLFNTVWIVHCSPNDPTKPSFPSSHVMVTWTIFLTTMIASGRFIKNMPLRVILIIVMIGLMAVVAAGRILSGDHWMIDVVVAMAIALVFSFIYWLLIREKKHEKRIQ